MYIEEENKNEQIEDVSSENVEEVNDSSDLGVVGQKPVIPWLWIIIISAIVLAIVACIIVIYVNGGPVGKDEFKDTSDIVRSLGF